MGQFINVSDSLSVRLGEYNGNSTIQLFVEGSKPVIMGFAKLQTILEYAHELEKIMQSTPIESAEDNARAQIARATELRETPRTQSRTTRRARVNDVSANRLPHVRETDNEQYHVVKSPDFTQSADYQQFLAFKEYLKEKKMSAEELSARTVNSPDGTRTTPAQHIAHEKNIARAQTVNARVISPRVARGIPMTIAFIVKGKRVSLPVNGKTDAIGKLYELHVAKESPAQIKARNGSAGHEFDSLVKSGVVTVVK